MTLTRPVCVLIAAALVLAGCDRIGNPITVVLGKRAAPDEFQVLPRAPLQMPRSLDLPVPRPGTPSPLDAQPERAAAMALLGTPAPQAAAGPTSGGEAALLAAAGASSDNADIRATLQADRDRADAGPYKPPLIWDLFGMNDGRDVDPADVLDPQTEARRLQSEGVAPTPVDPDDRPAGEAGAPAGAE